MFFKHHPVKFKFCGNPISRCHEHKARRESKGRERRQDSVKQLATVNQLIISKTKLCISREKVNLMSYCYRQKAIAEPHAL